MNGVQLLLIVGIGIGIAVSAIAAEEETARELVEDIDLRQAAHHTHT